MSLVAVGACYVDTILTTPHYPLEDGKQRASSFSSRRGGNCPNSLEVLQQLVAASHQPLALHLIAVLPARSSSASQMIKKGLGPDIQLGGCIFREASTEPASCYIIKSQATGSRTIINYSDLPDMTVNEFIDSVNAMTMQVTWFHFEGRIPEVTQKCIQFVRRRFPTAHVSVEIERPGRTGLQGLAEVANVVFYAKSWAIDRGYTTACDCLLKESARLEGREVSLMFCTWGEDGAAALDRETGHLIHVPAYTAPDFKIVDPVGAGDTFIAGILYALNCNSDWDLGQKVRFANRVAGMKVSQEGFSGLARALGSNDQESDL